jgi:LuxR family maltose regulon positive regulatory protein
MTVPILATKLYAPPTRPELVSRQRLVELLESNLDRKLTLVSAPAGYGKTTLVSEWVQFTDRPVGWLTLDRGDNDPIRFWRYVIAAIRTVDERLGGPVWAVLESGQQPPLDALVTALINDLVNVPSSIVLVLDDYHLIEAEPVHNSLNLLLDRLPPQLHLIITTRADPPLLLSRRRSRSELIEIRMADLCFSEAEAAEFLNTRMALDLSEEDVLSLKGRTEGWIVGLQMAAVAIRAAEAWKVMEPQPKHEFVTTFAGDDRYIGGYLIEEVLQRQAQPVQQFLIESSILDRFCAPLCDTVMGRSDSREVLDHLDQNNLFMIPLDSRRYWYRYHHLFADLLRRRLGQEISTEDVAALHLEASRWYEEEGLLAEAVSHALEIPDLDWATTLIERHAPDVASRGESTLVKGWLEALPEDRLRSRPYLCILCSSRDPLAPAEAVERWLDDAETAWEAKSEGGTTMGAVSEVDEIRFRGWMAATRAWLSLHCGDPPSQVVEYSRHALEQIPNDDLVYNQRARSNLFNVLGHAYWRLGDYDSTQQAFLQARRTANSIAFYPVSIYVTCNLARIALDRGKLGQAAEICQEGLGSLARPLHDTGHPLPAAGGLYIILGRVLLELNNLEGAERALNQGLELVTLTKDYGTLRDGYVGLTLLRLAQGDAEGGLESIAELERLGAVIKGSAGKPQGGMWLVQAGVEPRDAPFATRLMAEIVAETFALRIRCWLAQSRSDRLALDRASKLAEERSISLHSTESSPVEQLAMVRILVARWRAQTEAPDVEEKQSVLECLKDQHDVAEMLGQVQQMIEITVLLALAHLALGYIDAALGRLGRALGLAKPEGFVRTFVDEGAPMARLLYRAVEEGISPEYAGKLLAAFPVTTAEGELVSSRVEPEMVEPLSPREIEVLQLVAEGLSNRQIADRLFISPNTVRVHTSNIYGKLGVNSRTQAVAKARGLGVLHLE